MKNKPDTRNPDAPLFHTGHKRPVTRRDFIAQGFAMGGASLTSGSMLSMMLGSNKAAAALASDVASELSGCGVQTQGAGKIPFICFDLAGGVNIAGSNVLMGGQGGQFDTLSTAGYSKLGLPGDMVPGITEATPTATSNGDHTDTTLGLAFHSDSGFLKGILEKTSASTQAAINGAIIAARSENDTGNNPHNPMYGINRAGADGSLLTLIGSRSSESGGNSMAPAGLIDLSLRPTKVDRPSDVTGLVDVGDFGSLSQADAVKVMESMYRLSSDKLGLSAVDPKLTATENAELKDALACNYVKSADIANRFGDPTTLDPAGDPDIVGAAGIFTSDEFLNDREFQKTASVMKMVINGFAGAGTITMGGYDYHTGDRSTGEIRDLRAGRCMGACLEYAARVGVPLMMYVCSDGSVFSNGALDNSEDGRGKGVWTGDNQSTASSFFMVYNPNGRATIMGGTPDQQAIHQQIGYFRSDASVETAANPAANNVNLLVDTVVLNYLALHGEQGNLSSVLPSHGLGNSTLQDSLTAFEPIVNGLISNPV
ncbi:MAG: general secretion pathway protein GspF [Cellvibrionaceae bacterium]